MKKSSWLMIFSAVLIVIGIIVCVVGALNGVSSVLSISPDGVHFLDEALEEQFNTLIEEKGFAGLFTSDGSIQKSFSKDYNTNFTTLDISTVDAKVLFIYSDRKKFTCEYGYADDMPITLDVEDDTLIVRQTDDRFFLFKAPRKTEAYIKIYIPEILPLCQIRCETENGDVSISGSPLIDIGQIMIDTVSGDVDFDDFNAEVLRVDTVSGNISAGMLDTSNLNLHTISGNIAASSYSYSLNITNVSGDIEIARFSADIANFENVSGTTRLAGYIAEKMDINSVSGDIELTVAERPKNVTLNFSTVSGNLETTADRSKMTGSCVINVETVSGNMVLDFTAQYVP